MSVSDVWPRLGRWLLIRCKRTLLLATLLGFVFFFVISAFVAINRDHAQLSGLKAQLHGVSGLGPDHSDMLALGKLSTKLSEDFQAPKFRPNVQYFPDYLNKHVFTANVDQNDGVQLSGKNSGPDLDGEGEFEEAIKRKLSVVSTAAASSTKPFNSSLSSRVHTFYYAWYGNPQNDGRWYHWNHEYLRNWDKKDRRKFPQEGLRHQPEKGDVGASFFPQLGAYSSKDPSVIDEHMKMMRTAKIGVVVLSWYPPGLADEHGPAVDTLVTTLLNAALQNELKIALHIEPYAGRTPDSFRENLRYIQDTYGSHPGFYKYKGKPLYYIYDSYLTPAREWKRLLSSSGDISVRGSDLDATFIGLLVDYKHRTTITASGFDGFYTYFASNGFSYGSTWKNWRNLALYARKYSLLFIPSLGPGYNDLRVRPWNGQATRLRRKGLYYGLAWRTFLELKLPLISITSFNEWHEGTQIEPAVPKLIEDFSYSSYLPDSPDCYLRQTGEWVEKMLFS